MNRLFGNRRLYAQGIIKFLLVGVLNTVFGYAVYAFLIFIGVPYLTALFISTVAGVIFNYFSFGRIVFRSQGGFLVFGKFVFVYGVVYAVNACLLAALTSSLHFNPYEGQVICIPLNISLSWFLMNYWVYKKE